MLKLVRRCHNCNCYGHDKDILIANEANKNMYMSIYPDEIIIASAPIQDSTVVLSQRFPIICPKCGISRSFTIKQEES